MSRAALADELERAQPRFHRAGRGGRRDWRSHPMPTRWSTETASFRYLDCPRCAAACSNPTSSTSARACPKIVSSRLIHSSTSADALLVAGSSLTVFSGYRFVRHAAARGHAGRHHQPRTHPRRRPGDGQGRQRLLRDADAARRGTGVSFHTLTRAIAPVHHVHGILRMRVDEIACHIGGFARLDVGNLT